MSNSKALYFKQIHVCILMFAVIFLYILFISAVLSNYVVSI